MRQKDSNSKKMAEVSEKHKCFQCLFHCKTCNCSSDEASSVKELLCEVCISSHVIRSHVITDDKGNEPLVCQEHKMLEQEYCRTCDTTFCWKCNNKHSKHEFDTIAKGASDLRSEVFELLTELQDQEELLRTKKDEITEMIEKNKRKVSSLPQLIETEVERIRKTCLAVIGENCEMASNNFENVTQLVDETVVMQKKLRILLASSNVHFLKNFAKTRNQVFENHVAVEEMVERSEIGPEIDCQMKNISTMFDDFEEDLKKLIKSTQKIQKFPISKNHHSKLNEFILIGPRETVYGIVVSDGLLRIDHADAERIGRSDFELKWLSKRMLSDVSFFMCWENLSIEFC